MVDADHLDGFAREFAHHLAGECEGVLVLGDGAAPEYEDDHFAFEIT